MDFQARYKQLNAAQKRAVDTIDGPVMVIAGPGTGKTELLSMRTANILKQTDTLPENILCLTFTDSGADAMRARLVGIIGQAAYKVAIHTFHSFGTEVINQNSEFFYNGATFKPADELSSYEILHSIFDELDYTNPLVSKMNGAYVHLQDVLTTISQFKKSGLTGSELLSILDSNDTVLDSIEKDIANVLAATVKATTYSSLVPIAEKISKLVEPALPSEVTPLSAVIASSLTHATTEAEAADKPSIPITKWKKAWLEKDDSGSLVFKARKRQVKLRAAVAIYDTYLSRMQEAELYDFDDMILQVVHAMETQPSLRYNMQEKYQYIMVDEFQDTNMAQARILHNLVDNDVSEGRPDILVVGDDDQAIYSFQGADVGNIINFRHTYPATELITLTNNYRSVDTILNTARDVITQGTDRLENHIGELDKTLVARHTSKISNVSIVCSDTKSSELNFIVSDIKKRIDAGESPESIAVLARRHSEIIDLLPYFAKAEISVNYERRDNVLTSEPVVLIEAVARLVLALSENRHNEAEALLPKLIAHPAWQFSANDIWRLSLAAYSQHRTWMEIMALTPEFTRLHGWLIETAQQAQSLPLERLLDRLIGNDDKSEDTFASPFYNYFFSPDILAIQPDKYITHLEALRTIRAKLREYQPGSVPTLGTFISFIDLHRTSNTAITSVRRRSVGEKGAVNLMTAHKSKGLEFDSVYIMGAIDSAWGEKVRSRSPLISYPENLPLAPSGATLDERLRLFYVAMTRAKNNLAISYYNAQDSGKVAMKASFLLPLQIDDKLLKPRVTLDDRKADLEQEWYAPLVSDLTSSMKTLLKPTLEQYKLSATHLNTFLDVSNGGPQHFLMANLLRFPSAMSASAAYGSAIHATLQSAHTHLRATVEQRPQEDVLHDFEKQIADKHLAPDELELFLQKGSDSLQAFLNEKYSSFNPNQKAELSFSNQHAMLEDAHLTGALDLVEIDEGQRTVHVTDYKTGKPSKDWAGKTDYEKIKLHKYKQQLMFYKLLVENSRDYNKYTVDIGTLQFVEPTPSGDIVSLDLSFTADELVKFKALVLAVWKHITNLDLPDCSEYEPTYKGVLAFEADLLGES